MSPQTHTHTHTIECVREGKKACMLESKKVLIIFYATPNQRHNKFMSHVLDFIVKHENEQEETYFVVQAPLF